MLILTLCLTKKTFTLVHQSYPIHEAKIMVKIKYFKIRLCDSKCKALKILFKTA